MDTQPKKCTIVVQVSLNRDTLRRLELLQVALERGLGSLLTQAVDRMMPEWRGLVILAAQAGELPEGFDYEGLELKAVTLGRAERRERERKGLSAVVCVGKRT